MKGSVARLIKLILRLLIASLAIPQQFRINMDAVAVQVLKLGDSPSVYNQKLCTGRQNHFELGFDRPVRTG